jgi:predicted methyltransferase
MAALKGDDAMQNCAYFSPLVALAVGIAGCGKHGEVVLAEPGPDKAGRQETSPDKKESLMHDHKHAFADPSERAKKWNDPTRDQWQHPEEIVAALGLKPGAMVADVGAGTGYMVAHLSKLVGKEGTVVAIDTSQVMIEYLVARSMELGPATIVARKVDANDPELQTDSLDGVLMLDTWHHVSEREAYAEKVYVGLKRGGRFVVVDYSVDADVGPPKAMRLEPTQIIKELEAAGFRSETVKESMPRHYVVIGHKE